MSGRIYQNVVLQLKENTDRTIGVIDSDYRGPLGVALHNFREEPYTIEPGDRIAQLMVVPVVRENIEVVEELPPTERGQGGFGSTGR